MPRVQQVENFVVLMLLIVTKEYSLQLKTGTDTA